MTDLRRVRGVLMGILWIAAANASAEAGFRLFPSSIPPSHFFAPAESDSPAGFRLAAAAPAPSWSNGAEGFHLGGSLSASPQELSFPPSPVEKPPRLFKRSTTVATAVVLGGMTIGAFAGGIAYGYSGHFGFEAEKYFGKDTYAGGADKVSHFIISATAARELAWIYERQGHTRDQSLLLSLGVISLAGFIQEVGDGVTSYGFSWEDWTADLAGSLAGVALTRYGLNDLIGIRYGIVPNGVPPDPCCKFNLSPDYSHEFYSGDLKLAGLASRLNVNPGPARFLLVSATYCTRAYGYEPVRPDRQRNVGVDVGLNLPEIASALGVRETTWWGIALYKVLNIARIPFTAFGVRYDLNHRRWHGPDTGERFD